MLDRLKGRILWKTAARKEMRIESPAEAPPAYADDNPMFPTKPSAHRSNDSMGFVLGTDSRKSLSRPKRRLKMCRKLRRRR